MAIDTAAKRASALSFFQLGCLLPIPDGTIGQGDRQHLAGFYSGILAAAPPVGDSAYNICLGVGHPDNIDYDTPAATTAAGVETRALSVAALALADDIDYYIDVIAVSAASVESITGGPVRVRISAGALVSARPNRLAAARATAAAAGKIHLDAYYDASGELAAATKIVVGRVVDGSIDWTSPVQEISISGSTTIDADLDATYVVGQRIHLAVRAETAAGVQGLPTVMAPVVADTAGPPAPSELAATVAT